MRNTVVLLFICLLQMAALESAERPNILFLMADEFRHDCLSAAGHPLVKTPNLDRLAQSGVRFTNAYAASPVCSPSRATLFTGRYPQVHGVVRNGLPLKAGEVALPQILKGYGYATHMVGKLHLPPVDWFTRPLITSGGSGKEYRDFLKKRRPDFSGVSNTAALPETLVTYRSPCKGDERSPLRIATSILPDELYEESWVADRAIDFLNEQKGKDHPWFLFVSMLKPHSEFVIPEPYASMYDPLKTVLPSSFRAGAECFALDRSDANPRTFINDPKALQQIIAHYYGAVTLVDHHMGRILNALERLAIDNDTIVIFTADHGNMLGERNRMFKGVMYESSVKVPLILKAPGRAPSGRVLDAVLDNTSVMPTLLELAGIPVPGGIQGKSLGALMKNGEAKWSEVAFSALRHRMIRHQHWKLIDPYEDDTARPELYDLAKDPNEEVNLYGRPEVADVQNRLSEMLQQGWRQKPPPVTGN